MDASLKTYLEERKVSYVLHTHGAIYTVAEGQDNEDIMRIPGLRCKTLFLKDDRGKYYLVGMLGVKRLDFKKLERACSVKKMRMGSPEELLRETGLIPGSVSIFGAVQHKNVTLVLDEEIWQAENVCFHPNINTETLELSHGSLARYYNSLPNPKQIIAL